MSDDRDDDKPQMGRILTLVPGPARPPKQSVPHCNAPGCISLEDMLEHALEDVRECPDQNRQALMVIFDADDEPAFWGTHMSKAQVCKAVADLQLYCQQILQELVET